MRFRMHAAVVSFLLSLAVAAPVLAQTSAGSDSARAGTRHVSLGPAPRTGWMIGIGGGYGVGGPTIDNGPDQEAGQTLHFRSGLGVSPHAVLGFEFLSWSASPSDTTTFDLEVAGPSLTWYWDSNLYVRGMVGWAMGEAEFEVGTGPTHTVTTLHDDGFACLVAAGWEWRFRHRFALAPEVGYVRAGLAPRLSYTNAWGGLSLNLYY